MSDPRTPSAANPQPPGATSVGGDRRKSRKGLWLALAAVAAVLALLLLLSQCSGEDPQPSGAASSSSSAEAPSSSAAPSGTASSTASSTTGGSAGTAAPGAGTPGSVVTADGRSVLELGASADPAGGLASATGQAVTGTAVQVLTVPADEGFWVGTSDADRVWVQLSGEAGESPYTVQQGDSVDFTGAVTAHDAGFAGQVGVDEAEGGGQLTGQAAHVEAPRSSVVLAG